MRKIITITQIQPLYSLTTFFGQTPAFNFLSNDQSSKTLTYVRSIIMIFVSVSTFAYFLYGCSAFLIYKMEPTEIIVNSILYFCTTVVNLLCIAGSLLKNKSWIKMLQTFSALENQLIVKLNPNEIIWTYLELLIENMIVLLVLFYEVIGLVETFQETKYYLAMRIQVYLLFLTIHLICKFALCLKSHLRQFNNLLLSIGLTNRPGKKNICYAIKVYERLCYGYNMYNNIFGWEIFVFMGVVMLKLLESFNTIFLESSSGIMESQPKSKLITLTLTTSLVYLVSRQ